MLAALTFVAYVTGTLLLLRLSWNTLRMLPSSALTSNTLVVKIKRAGRYRAFVKIHPGALVSGASRSIVLKASK